jgi:drug/metabolite transporter (DMT)-like permease
MTPSTARTPLLANIAFLLACFFWGTTYVAIAIAVKAMPATVLVGSRFFIAGILFLLLSFIVEGVGTWPSLTDLAKNSVVGLALLFLANGFVSLAEKSVPISYASLIITFTPLCFVGLARWTGEYVSRQAWVGLGVGLLAMFFLLWPKLNTPEQASTFIVGTAMLLGACLCWSAGSVFARVKPASLGKLRNVAIQNFAGGGAGLIAALIIVGPGGFTTNPGAPALWAVVYLIVFGSLVGYLAYTYCLAHLSAERVGLIPYANTLVAVSIGVAFFDEALDLFTIIGAALVFTSVAIVNSARHKLPPAKIEALAERPKAA